MRKCWIVLLVICLFGGVGCLKRHGRDTAATAGTAGVAAKADLPRFDPATRRDRNKKILRDAGVLSVPDLKMVDETTAHIRKPEVAARKTLAWYIVAYKAQAFLDVQPDLLVRTATKAKALQFINDTGVRDFLTFHERSFVFDTVRKFPEEEQAELTDFSWRSERVWVLLWALNCLEKLELPSSKCDLKELQQILEKISQKENGLADFVQNAKLRPAAEILDHYDLVRLCNKIGTDAKEKKQTPPAKIDLEVGQEWELALGWLVRSEPDPEERVPNPASPQYRKNKSEQVLRARHPRECGFAALARGVGHQAEDGGPSSQASAVGVFDVVLGRATGREVQAHRSVSRFLDYCPDADSGGCQARHFER